jgi:hypothetical protein
VEPPNIPGVVEQKNYLRFPSPGDTRAGWQKEWFHFCILTPELSLLINLNVCGDLRPAAVPGSRVARVLMMASTPEGWFGDLETVDPRDVVLRPGEVAMVLGQNRMSFYANRFHLVAALQTQPLLADVRLEPLTDPLGFGGEISVGKGSIGWFAVPQLSVRGHVVVGGSSYPLEAASAYHDHNWGRWRWGEDFSWEWGFAHLSSQGKEPPGSKWSLVLDRTSNRARTRLLESTLALWRDRELIKVFSRREITVRPVGYRNPGAIFRVPRAMSLAVPALGRDVPREFHVTAISGRDRISFVLHSDDEAQVLVPNETDLETTIITEVTGQVRMEGVIRDQRVDAEGRGIFEFLST